MTMRSTGTGTGCGEIDSMTVLYGLTTIHTMAPGTITMVATIEIEIIGKSVGELNVDKESTMASIDPEGVLSRVVISPQERLGTAEGAPRLTTAPFTPLL
jgi:hypothetical protein